MEKLSIGALTNEEEEEEEEKKKDNMYKLNKAMAIAIGLIRAILITLNMQTNNHPRYSWQEHNSFHKGTPFLTHWVHFVTGMW